MEIDEKGSGDVEAEGDIKKGCRAYNRQGGIVSNRTTQDTAIQEYPEGQDQRAGGSKRTSAV